MAHHETQEQFAEIEAALRGHTHVRQVAVAMRPRGGEDTLVAYIVAEGISPTVGQLRSFLQDRLPPHLVPSLFVALDELPLTPDGAVDLAALPPITPVVTSAEETPYTPPRNDVEAAFAAIFAEALLVERVGIHDDFLDVGGDSLIATQIVAQIWERFQIEIPLQALFERGTIAALVDEFCAGVVMPEKHA
jgi:surfactin family lipopeptide synthetase A